MSVTPRVDAPIQSAGRILPLGIGRQTPAAVLAELVGLLPCDAVDRVVAAVVVALVAQRVVDLALVVPLGVVHVAGRPPHLSPGSHALALLRAGAELPDGHLRLVDAKRADLDLMGRTRRSEPGVVVVGPHVELAAVDQHRPRGAPSIDTGSGRGRRGLGVRRRAGGLDRRGLGGRGNRCRLGRIQSGGAGRRRDDEHRRRRDSEHARPEPESIASSSRPTRRGRRASA